MAKVGFLVALLAAAAAGWLATEVGSLRTELKAQQELLAEIAGRSAPERASASGSEPTAFVRGAGAGVAATSDEDPAAGPALAARPADPATLAVRVEELEKRFTQQEKTVASLKEEGPRPFFGRAPRFIHDAASAARELQLDDRQRAEVERIVEVTRRELEDLRSLPNDEGMTWKEASRVKFEGSADGGAMIAFGSNMQKMDAFKKTRIPGSSETYGEADRRIRSQAKDRVRRLLNAEQTKTFEDSHTDAMFGGMGGMSGEVAAISIATEGIKVGEGK